MTVEMLAHGSNTMRQRRALEPYVAKLEEALRRQPRSGTHPTVVSIDEFSLSLEPWIAARMSPPGAAPEAESGRTELVRQTVALWLKILVDLRILGDGVLNPCGNLYELQAELMLDSAFGSSLLRELQDAVDGLVKRGDLDEARRFSKLQRHVRSIVRDMKRSITQSNGAQADEAAESPAELPAELPAAPEPAPAPIMNRTRYEADHEVPAPRPRRRPRPQPTAAAPPGHSRGSSRTTILVTLNAVAFVAYVAVAAPFLAPRRTLRALTLGDLPSVAPLIEIQSRPPALYATVDGKTWSELDDKQKRHFVDGIGSVLLTEGYGGLLLKTQDGRLVGNWLEHGGTRLFDAKPGVPASPGTPVDPSAPMQGTALASATGVAAQFSRFVP